jgi:homoserine kinase
MTRMGISVPATTANLGPGYDSFGLALELRNEVFAALADTWSITIEGEGAGELGYDESNLIIVAMKAVFAEAGHDELCASVKSVNRIPLGSGLGSSAAALVGGAALARLLLREYDSKFRMSDQDLFRLLAPLEGHPDNIAPAIFGGFTICWDDDVDDPQPRVENFQLVSPMAAVVVPSAVGLATSYARTLLPDMVPHADAAFTVAHAGLLAAALVSGRLEMLHVAVADKLHQPYRTGAISDFAAVRRILLDAGCDAVAISGAGPTIIAFVTGFTPNSSFIKAQKIAESTTESLLALGSQRQPPCALNFAVRGYRPL